MNREIDALIAEKVMGWERMRADDLTFFGPRGRAVIISPGSYPSFLPSRDIKDAYEMEEEILRQGKHILYAVMLGEVLYNRKDWNLSAGVAWVIAHASPKDRCLAALKTYGIESHTIKTKGEG